MKNNVPDTAGNTPEPWMRDAAAEIMSVWRGNVMPFNEQSMAKIIAARAPATPSQAQAFAESDCYRVRGADGISERVYVDIEAVTKFIRLLDAAPSQEAAMPQYYFPCCRRFYAHAENCRAEPAPSPATFTISQMKALLEIRNALVNDDPTEAYRLLYELADRGRNSLTPWDEWESTMGQFADAPSPAIKCKHCGEPLFDNGTVGVHIRFDNGALLQSQWCDDSKKVFAEPDFAVVSPSPATLHEEVVVKLTRRAAFLRKSFGENPASMACLADELERQAKEISELAVAPSPATKDTPQINAIPSNRAGNSATLKMEAGLCIGTLIGTGVSADAAKPGESSSEFQSRVGATKNFRNTEVISQGPAREETLDKIITDILKLHGHPVTHNSKALARELFDAGAQSRTPTNLESRTVAPQNDGSLEKRLEIAEESERGGHIRIAGAHKLLKEILDTVNLQPSVCRGSPLDDVAQIPWAIRDLQNCYVDAAKARNGLYTKMQERAETAEAKLRALAGAAALPSTPIEDIEVLEQVADYLRQLGGGPMEDRLRLLHERLAASVPAASSPTKESQQWMRDASEEIRQCCLQQAGYLNAGLTAEIIAKHYAASSTETNQGWIAVETSKPVIAASCLFWVTGGEFWEAGYYRGENPNCWECERTDAMEEKIYYSEGEVSYWMIPSPPVASQPAKEED